MWKVDDTGSFQFSDYQNTRGTMSLFSGQPNFQQLEAMILERFEGQRVSIEDLSDWVIVETPFLRTHLKSSVLAPLERSGAVFVISPSPRRRRGTFSDGTMLQF